MHPRKNYRRSVKFGTPLDDVSDDLGELSDIEAFILVWAIDQYVERGMQRDQAEAAAQVVLGKFHLNKDKDGTWCLLSIL
jgi:hypothetical protein